LNNTPKMLVILKGTGEYKTIGDPARKNLAMDN